MYIRQKDANQIIAYTRTIYECGSNGISTNY